MIKKSVFENEIIANMQIKLAMPNSENINNQLSNAIDNINNVIDIFEDAGLHSQADKLLNILTKIASKSHNDSHTKGLNSEKMVKNLLHHGTPFNMANDGVSDELLNSDILEDLEVDESAFEDLDFEDEI